MNKRQIGAIGEKIAQKYLINKKYKIITTNFYTKRGEIDIIATENNYLIFIEVKTRTNNKYGTPGMAVNSVKINHMKLAAKVFLMLNKFEKYKIRFDVIEIIIKNKKILINHIKQII